MLHPSYSELINAVNSEVAEGEEPVVNSRYSIVIATAKRARQLVAGEEPLVMADEKKKPLSIAVDELYNGQVKILSEESTDEENEWETAVPGEEDLELDGPETDGSKLGKAAGEEDLQEASAGESGAEETGEFLEQAVLEEPATEGISEEHA